VQQHDLSVVGNFTIRLLYYKFTCWVCFERIFRSSPGDDLIDCQDWNSGVSVRMSTKSFSYFDLIWCATVWVDRSTRYAHQYDLDPIQGQGQGYGACEVSKITLFYRSISSAIFAWS